jgi:hypothetical protein
MERIFDSLMQDTHSVINYNHIMHSHIPNSQLTARILGLSGLAFILCRWRETLQAHGGLCEHQATAFMVCRAFSPHID